MPDNKKVTLTVAYASKDSPCSSIMLTVLNPKKFSALLIDKLLELEVAGATIEITTVADGEAAVDAQLNITLSCSGDTYHASIVGVKSLLSNLDGSAEVAA